MMHKAWCSIEDVPYYFLGSSIKFQGHTGWKIDNMNPIWVRLLGWWQLSNPSDLPCFFCLYFFFSQKNVRGPKHPREVHNCRNSSPYIKHFILSKYWQCPVQDNQCPERADHRRPPFPHQSIQKKQVAHPHPPSVRLFKVNHISIYSSCKYPNRSRGHQEEIHCLSHRFQCLFLYLFFFSCDQAALRTLISVCRSVCHTFLTMFLLSYHHEIFKSYCHWQTLCPCKRSRSQRSWSHLAVSGP